MAQIENEWNPGSNCMQRTGPSSWTDQDENGVDFYLWNWRLVDSLGWGIPWMWNSGVPPPALLKGRTTGLIAGADGDHVRGAPGGLWIEDEGEATALCFRFLSLVSLPGGVVPPIHRLLLCAADRGALPI